MIKGKMACAHMPTFSVPGSPPPTHPHRRHCANDGPIAGAQRTKTESGSNQAAGGGCRPVRGAVDADPVGLLLSLSVSPPVMTVLLEKWTISSPFLLSISLRLLKVLLDLGGPETSQANAF